MCQWVYKLYSDINQTKRHPNRASYSIHVKDYILQKCYTFLQYFLQLPAQFLQHPRQFLKILKHFLQHYAQFLQHHAQLMFFCTDLANW